MKQLSELQDAIVQDYEAEIEHAIMLYDMDAVIHFYNKHENSEWGHYFDFGTTRTIFQQYLYN